MSKLAVMMSAENADAPLSGHFGKAEWILIFDGTDKRISFVRNAAGQGRGVAEVIAGLGCADVILAGIGGGALACLKAAGIRAWAAPRDLSGRQSIERFFQGNLPGVEVPLEREAGGCCGRSGHREAGESGCCGGAAGCMR